MNSAASLATSAQRRHTRRAVLTMPPLIAAAVVLGPTPARANPRIIECLADLEAVA